MTTLENALQRSLLFREQPSSFVCANFILLKELREPTCRLSIQNKECDLDSIAVDMACLLSVDAERDCRFVVFLPTRFDCKHLIRLVEKRFKDISQLIQDSGCIWSLNREACIEITSESGFVNRLWVFPPRREYLRVVGALDLVIKVNGDYEFEEEFRSDVGYLVPFGHIVTLDYHYATGDLLSTADGLENLIEKMKI